VRREEAFGCRGVPRVSAANKDKQGWLVLREAAFGRFQENEEPPAEFGVPVPAVRTADTAASGFLSTGDVFANTFGAERASHAPGTVLVL